MENVKSTDIVWFNLSLKGTCGLNCWVYHAFKSLPRCMKILKEQLSEAGEVEV